ncbi:hypothetical protein FRB99_005452 [Tulasnella sp. 403]|nr:hypothetical protein FRB99_005452 [Tulasnella sp. 403]
MSTSAILSSLPFAPTMKNITSTEFLSNDGGVSVPSVFLTVGAVYVVSRIVKSFVWQHSSDVHKVPSPPGAHWLWGHEMKAFMKSCGQQYREWFDETGTVYKIKAALWYGDILTTADAGIINHVLTKHIYEYEKSPMIRPIAERLVGHGLVWAEGETHKRQRNLLNPAFTIDNVRNMAPDVMECTERFITALETKLLGFPGAEGSIDMQEWTAKVTLDIIGRVGFGHDFHLGASPEAQRILKGWKNQATQGFSPMAIVAGHETTSGTVNYTLHELAKNQDLQTRLRREIIEFHKEIGREATFEEYMNGNKMPLLDAVTKEALRMYPAASYTERTAIKDDVLPLRNPIELPNGKTMTEIRIKAGQAIFFPVVSINRINSRWGDGETFRPERWLSNNADELPDKSELPSAGWNGSLTFSAGARLCIGYKLALYEYKILLASLIRRFVFHDSKTQLEFRFVGSLQPRVVGREDEGVQLPIHMSFVDEDDY